MKKKEAVYDKVEVQKGPIDMQAQYSMNFHARGEPTREDIKYNEMRQDKMTMELHTPKH